MRANFRLDTILPPQPRAVLGMAERTSYSRRRWRRNVQIASVIFQNAAGASVSVLRAQIEWNIKMTLA